MRAFISVAIAVTLLSLWSCGGSAPEPPAAAADDAARNKALVAQLTEAFNTRDAQRLEAIVAPDFVKHGTPGQGPAVFAQTIAMFDRAFPSFQVQPQMVLAEGDRVAVYYHGSGVQEGPFLNVPAQGREVSAAAVDIFRIEDGRIVEQWAVADVFGMLQQMTGPLPAPAPLAALPVETVATFEPPTFLESLAFSPAGELFVTDLFGARIYRIDGEGNAELFFEPELARAPGLRGVFCLVFDDDGALYATVNSPDPAQHGVWRINPDGSGAPLAALPAGTVPNGITWDGRGNLLVADSAAGLVWRVDPASAAAQVWLDHPLIKARPYLGQFPPANGVQRHGSDVYVANSDQGRMVRVPVQADGSAGEPVVAVADLGGDDFAVDSDGTLYVTTHPFNTVVRVSPDGQRAVVAGAEQGIVGPSAAVIREEGGERYLYVVTDGGFYSKPGAAPVPPPAQTPGVFRLRLDG